MDNGSIFKRWEFWLAFVVTAIGGLIQLDVIPHTPPVWFKLALLVMMLLQWIVAIGGDKLWQSRVGAPGTVPKLPLPTDKVTTALVLLGTVMLLAGCSNFVAVGRQTLISSEKTVIESAKSLQQLNSQQQERFIGAIQRAQTPEELQRIKADFNTWNMRVDKVMEILTDIDALNRSGPPLFALVELGVKKDTDVAQWLQQLFDLAMKLQSAIRQLGSTIGTATAHVAQAGYYTPYWRLAKLTEPLVLQLTEPLVP